jgi:hypothetical protein
LRATDNIAFRAELLKSQDPYRLFAECPHIAGFRGLEQVAGDITQAEARHALPVVGDCHHRALAPPSQVDGDARTAHIVYGVFIRGV